MRNNKKSAKQKQRTVAFVQRQVDEEVAKRVDEILEKIATKKIAKAKEEEIEGESK